MHPKSKVRPEWEQERLQSICALAKACTWVPHCRCCRQVGPARAPHTLTSVRASLPLFCSLPSKPAPCSIIFTTTCTHARVMSRNPLRGGGSKPACVAYYFQRYEVLHAPHLARSCLRKALQTHHQLLMAGHGRAQQCAHPPTLRRTYLGVPEHAKIDHPHGAKAQHLVDLDLYVAAQAKRQAGSLIPIESAMGVCSAKAPACSTGARHCSWHGRTGLQACWPPVWAWWGQSFRFDA